MARELSDSLETPTHPLPAIFGLSIAPMTASVASVAFKGSDSNHLSKMCKKEDERPSKIAENWGRK